MSGGPLRLGLIGAGRWGKAYLRTIAQMTGASLTRVSSRNPETSTLVPPGCAVDADWRAVVAAADVDAIIVASPPSTHFEIASQALRAGKPLLLEKPAALLAADVRTLLEQARRAGLHVLVEHTLLFHPAYLEIKRRAAANGPAQAVISEGTNWGPFRQDLSPLWDYGPHDVSMALDLIGRDPQKIAARVEQLRKEDDQMGRNFRLAMSFPGGATADILVGNGTERKQRRFEARFKEETLVFDDLASHKLVRSENKGGQAHPIAVNSKPPLTAAVEAFVAAVAAGSKDVSSLEFAVRVVETLQRCEDTIKY
jgi:predicted dehydrogenase